MALTGKVAVITSAARGSGRAIARRFAAAGARAVVADLQADVALAMATDHATPIPWGTVGRLGRNGLLDSETVFSTPARGTNREVRRHRP